VGTRANSGPERECKKPLRSREEWGGVLGSARVARENSLAGEACEGISGFAAKSFARAPTPASYADYLIMKYNPFLMLTVKSQKVTSILSNLATVENTNQGFHVFFFKSVRRSWTLKADSCEEVQYTQSRHRRISPARRQK